MVKLADAFVPQARLMANANADNNKKDSETQQRTSCCVIGVRCNRKHVGRGYAGAYRTRIVIWKTT